MSRISIHPGEVLRMHADVQARLATWTHTSGEYRSLRYQVDSRIVRRYSIDQRMQKIACQFDQIQGKMATLHQFVRESMAAYSRVEEKLVQQTNARELSSGAKQSHGHSGFQWKQIFYIAAPIGHTMLNNRMVELVKMARNLRFKQVQQDGVRYIKVQNWKSFQAGELREQLKTYLGGKKWSWSYANQLLDRGIPLYNTKDNEFIRKYAGRMLQTKFTEMNTYISHLSESIPARAWSYAKKGAVQGVSFWNDFDWRNTKTLTKIGKGAGIAGTVIGFVGNYQDTMYSNKGEFDPSAKNVTKLVTNTAIDVGAAATAAAAGAAAGSFIVPPVGTVVGAVAGVTVHVFMNVPAFKGESVVSYSKKKVNKWIDDVASRGLWNSVGKKLGNIF